ncbi:signal transducer and activator of transcription 1-alpha/beta-like [Scomber scombrus]|uniref:Signal transducer and activator of transcription n=1 Tax=Scomber scombrus TaxID=13677 RepID=A0AAV1PQT4_SCOSC
MAQWQELLRLDSALQGQVSQLYNGKFPREIRHYLSAWIESQNWDLAAVNEDEAGTCFYALVEFLEEQWNRSVQENNILQGPDFRGFSNYLQTHFLEMPLKLAVILSECLKEEKKILASASEAQGCGRPAVEQTGRELDNKVEELKRKTLEVKKEIKSLEALYGNLDFIQINWQRGVEQHVGLAESRAFVEDECWKQTNFIVQTKKMVLQQIRNIIHLAKETVGSLTGVELPEWRHRQQMACIGSPVDTSLDHLQKWFTTVAEVLQQVHQELQKLQDQSNKYNITNASDLPGLSEIKKLTLSLYKELLGSALVVEKQPIMFSLPHRPLILKTGVRFSLTLRFLANLPEFKCRLKVKAVFDKDVEEVKTIIGFRRFDFTTVNSKVMDVDAQGGDLVAEFENMSLGESVKVRKKGPSQSRLGVTEELHVIKFVMEFQHDGLEFDIEASSLPVVVVSSTNQIPSAWASVMWSSMLSTSEPRNLSLFVKPPPLSWQQLSQALSWQFLSVGQKELNKDQLSMLKDKIVDDPADLVDWHKFSKVDSTWIWIDGILDLIKKHLMDFWRQGYIMGFVSRKKSESLLKKKQTGTFLIRFSESIKDGAITFSWVDHSNGDAYVHAVEPYTKTELSSYTLPHIVYNYSLKGENSVMKNPLTYLYPDIHKDTAFEHYYTSTKMSKPISKDGYVLRRTNCLSDNPTPPPSPPQEMLDMDMDTDADTCVQNAIERIENQQRLQELFPQLSPAFYTS